ncbi:MAG: 2-amino-4-hydroxy-6-hydroxymethyldihydropteridine diphosphokinase [Rhodobacteraceae bacterium]|nr:2-amino-4-hydroxy-6-hydroxymethyldihydropteridine diphosphokinase [Paracoccaceae bacterium]
MALGGNWPSHFGSPAQTIVSAIGEIARVVGAIVAVSRFYRTPAFPIGAGPDFVNAAVLVECAQGCETVLSALHEIEANHGRVRERRWGARTLDLDLLFYGAEVRPDEKVWHGWADLAPERQAETAPDRLILPHPRLQDRGFVLIPLADIAPGWRHPVTGVTVAGMANALSEEEIAAIRPWG